MLRRRLIVGSLPVLFLLSLTAWPMAARATSITPAKGWGVSADQEKAWQYAQKRGVPLVVVYTFKETTCPLCVGASIKFMATGAWANAAKLLVYDDDKGIDEVVHLPRGAFLDKEGKNRDNLLLPCVILFDSKRRFVGLARYAATADEVAKLAAAATQASAFLAKAEKELEAADQAIAAGRYRTALASLEKVVKDDHALARHLKTSFNGNNFLRQTYGQRQKAELAKLAGSGDAKKFEAGLADYVKKDAESLAARSRSKEAAEAVEKEYLAFPGILSHRTERCAEGAQKRLDEAKALVEQGKLPQAKLALDKLAFDAAGLDAGKQAADLLKELNTRKAAAAK